jgi:hypothetical protein
VQSYATSYQVTKGTGFFSEINTLLIALQGVAVSTELYLSGKVAHKPGDYVTVEAKHLNARVRLPLYGPIQAALANKKPDIIEITVVSGKESEREFAHWTSGFQEFVLSIFLPFLVSYHEAYRAQIEKRFSAGRHTWPEPWQMSWAIRNAASHNGRVFDKLGQRPVFWRGLDFSPADEPNKQILNLVNGGDLLVLMLELEETRTGASLKNA